MLLTRRRLLLGLGCLTLGGPVEAAPVVPVNTFAAPGTIHYFIERGDIARVRQMLQASPRLRETRQSFLGTPLATAAYVGNLPIVTLLLGLKANVNARTSDAFDTQTVLMAACSNNDYPEATRLQIVRLLVDKGALVRVVDRSGSTALHDAAFWGLADVANFLLSRGADIGAIDGDGRTPFTEAFRGAAQWDDWRLVRFARVAVGAGANVNVRALSGDTMLHLAVKGGQPHAVEFLLGQNADINAPDRAGRTPLAVALAHNQTEIAALLRGYGGKETPPPPAPPVKPKP